MSLRRRINSFRYAFNGVFDLVRTQPNARIHLIACVAVVAAGFWLDVSRNEWAILALCMASVLSLEAANTALEYIVDLVSPEYHPLAGKAKDVAAAAVLIAAFGAVVVGLLIFAPKLIALF